MGVQTRFHDDEGKLVVERVQDVEPILEDAKRRGIEGRHGSKDFRHVASLPFVLIEKYCNDNGISFSEWMRNPVHVERMLQDRDLAYFRVAP